MEQGTSPGRLHGGPDVVGTTGQSATRRHEADLAWLNGLQALQQRPDSYLG